MERLSILSAPAEAATDIRRACNGIKRMAALSAAAMVGGLEPKATVRAAEKMAIDVLSSIGFDVNDEQRMQSVLPMMMEATSVVLGEAVRQGGLNSTLQAEALDAAAKRGAQTLTEVAKSRAVAKMIEVPYPTDIDATVALRISAAAAMAVVFVEVASFDYMHEAEDCIKEAGKVVVKAATEGASKLSPQAASTASRVMLTQSLIASGARIYAATWRAVAASETARLDALLEAPLTAELARMEAEPLSKLLAPVHQRFNSAFAAITDGARDMFISADPGQVKKPSTPRPR